MDEENGVESVQENEDFATPDESLNGDAESKTENSIIDAVAQLAIVDTKNESGIVLEAGTVRPVRDEELELLTGGEELVVGGGGSDSGVEGCGGRALSSGGGSRSCASSVVSCGSGCGSESSSLAGATAPAPRPRRRVALHEPTQHRPVGTSTPRAPAPRAPNLATRDRARSREKPTPPEKPRPLTPKPRVRPHADLPHLIRESPALRAKPTKTSAARCRTPAPVGPPSPGSADEKRWPSTNGARINGVTEAVAARLAADKFATLPRRRCDTADGESSPRRGTPPETTSPIGRRSSGTRTVSSRLRTRVRIYAEKCSQTVLCATDVDALLAGRDIGVEARSIREVSHRGVQADGRSAEAAKARVAEEALSSERVRREQAERELAEERSARRHAEAELERNARRLLELAGAAVERGGGADECLRALDEQLRSADRLTHQQRTELDRLHDHNRSLQHDLIQGGERCRELERRLTEAEREAAEMQEFLGMETRALGEALREAEGEAARAHAELEKRRAECRQLVRLCEVRRQEALAERARSRRAPGAARALDALAHRLQRLLRTLLHAHRLPPDTLQQLVFHNEAYSRSDSEDGRTPEDGSARPLVPTACSAMPAAAPLADDDKSHVSDDNSADLLDSETEPSCMPLTDADLIGGSCGSLERLGWSCDELSPVRDDSVDASVSERDSIRDLSAAIARRQRSEDGRDDLLDKVVTVDNMLSDLLRVLKLAYSPPNDDALALFDTVKERIEETERGVSDVVMKKLAELEASKHLMHHYEQNIEELKRQVVTNSDVGEPGSIEEELRVCGVSEPRAVYEALDGALVALAGRQRAVSAWPRLQRLQAQLERLAFALAVDSPPLAPCVPTMPQPLDTTA